MSYAHKAGRLLRSVGAASVVSVSRAIVSAGRVDPQDPVATAKSSQRLRARLTPALHRVAISAANMVSDHLGIERPKSASSVGERLASHIALEDQFAAARAVKAFEMRARNLNLPFSIVERAARDLGGVPERSARALAHRLKADLDSGKSKTEAEAAAHALRARLRRIRAAAIAEQFTTRSFSEGTRSIEETTGPLDWIWRTEEDGRVCAICEPLNGVITTDIPPAHPRCRCVIEPVEPGEMSG